MTIEKNRRGRPTRRRPIGVLGSGLGVTLVPKLALAAGITAGADVVLRPLQGAGGWRTIALAWRPGSPRAAEYRALAPLIAAALTNNPGNAGPAS